MKTEANKRDCDAENWTYNEIELLSLEKWDKSVPDKKVCCLEYVEFADLSSAAVIEIVKVKKWTIFLWVVLVLKISLFHLLVHDEWKGQISLLHNGVGEHFLSTA